MQTDPNQLDQATDTTQLLDAVKGVQAQINQLLTPMKGRATDKSATLASELTVIEGIAALADQLASIGETLGDRCQRLEKSREPLHPITPSATDREKHLVQTLEAPAPTGDDHNDYCSAADHAGQILKETTDPVTRSVLISNSLKRMIGKDAWNSQAEGFCRYLGIRVARNSPIGDSVISMARSSDKLRKLELASSGKVSRKIEIALAGVTAVLQTDGVQQTTILGAASCILEHVETVQLMAADAGEYYCERAAFAANQLTTIARAIIQGAYPAQVSSETSKLPNAA